MTNFSISKRYVSFIRYSMIGSHVFETGHKEEYSLAAYNLARRLDTMIKPGEYITVSQARSRLKIDRVPSDKALVEGKGLGVAVKGITVEELISEFSDYFKVEGRRIYKI
jgi:hypothetical protein